MTISFESALGIHEKALALRSRRTEMLASNIANSDTPGYKAKDLDFKSALANIEAQSGNSLTRTNSKHIPISTTDNNVDILYRVPNQSSLDGNTVDEQIEKSAFADNALRYQASITFLDGKFKGMIAALKGE
jgi:flagellar basal-body rod protein FlgB